MKTNQLFSTVLLFLALFINTGLQAALTGDGRQNRSVDEFHGISVSSGIDLYLTQKNVQEVRVEADEEDMGNLITEVEGGILRIYMKEKSWFNLGWSHSTRKVYVSFKTLDKLEASAGSDVVCQSVMNLTNLDLDASSGSDVKLELNADQVNAVSSSGSDIKLKGKANYLQANASSAGDIDAVDFQTKKCSATASSGSDLYVYATEQLDANASSGADIAYSGNPARKNINESSGGDVHNRK
ncbi:MAG: head GIN domain-containing protein [Methylococcaceae bacterium]|nr:head GIN domain-containing protein [Prolixibacteraceae bacterium]